MDMIHQWIIVYDSSNNRRFSKLFLEYHPQILEVECPGGISGNPQRNYSLQLVQDGFIYFLDDDNIVHPTFWRIWPSLDSTYFYTFDQQRPNNTILHGNAIAVNKIDTAMFIVHKKHVGTIRWRNDRYDADGYFITDIFIQNPGAHRYLNVVASYYNYLHSRK